MKTFANKYQPFTLRVPIDFLATVTLRFRYSTTEMAVRKGNKIYKSSD